MTDLLLQRTLEEVEHRVRVLIEHRRAGDPHPDDPFRGLYVNDETVDQLLATHGTAPPWPPSRPVAPDEHGGLAELAAAAGLTPFEVELLVVAVMPDLDPRFERLYGYLNDDVTRRRASIGLALELTGASPMSAPARAALSARGSLVENGLVLVEDGERPLLGRALRVPDRVTAHLLGSSAPDDALIGVLQEVEPYRTPLAQRLAAAVSSGVTLTHVRERDGGGTGTATAVAALAAAGLPAVVADLSVVARDHDAVLLSTVLVREQLLLGAGLVAGPIETLAEAHPEAVHRLSASRMPVVLVGSLNWDPRWSAVPPLTVDAPTLGAGDRLELLVQQLRSVGAHLDVASHAAHLSLGPTQVAKAVGAARAASLLDGGVVTVDHLRTGVRAQNAAGLEHLARRIQPQVGWDDLVLTPVVRRALEGLSARARHRDQVLVDWRMRSGGGRGRGVTALFAGDSGTGKTMSAEVIAADLALDLYTVDLATVVDKYVGETEKNLERIFSEAGGVNAVLFFDEADAIFGKRSDVRDAHDRYANIESAYLLQRLETFDGLAILATNLRSNIDEAFTRRLDAIVDFPAPTPDLREELWRKCLAPPLPVGDDVDVEFCARSFDLAGGNIRSTCISAAYLAAVADRPVGMAEVVAAVEQEYRKLGRLVLEREFGPYLALLRA
jgi:hypothetical protein